MGIRMTHENVSDTHMTMESVCIDPRLLDRTCNPRLSVNTPPMDNQSERSNER